MAEDTPTLEMDVDTSVVREAIEQIRDAAEAALAELPDE